MNAGGENSFYLSTSTSKKPEKKLKNSLSHFLFSFYKAPPPPPFSSQESAIKKSGGSSIFFPGWNGGSPR